MSGRRLALKKETVTELTPDDLGGVAAGSFPTKYDCTLSYDACIASIRACVPTIGRPCIPTQTC